MTKKISVIVGSLRRESVARKIANNVAKMFSDEFEVSFVEIGNLPIYNCDYDDPKADWAPVPAEYDALRSAIKSSDGVLIVTAENNRLVPACVKNVVDICSKPAGDSAWKGLPAAIISHSVGRMGGFSSHKSLKLALSYFAMPMVPQPEVFLGNSHDLFKDADGNMGDTITNESTVEFLRGYVGQFEQLVRDNPRD